MSVYTFLTVNLILEHDTLFPLTSIAFPINYIQQVYSHKSFEVFHVHSSDHESVILEHFTINFLSCTLKLNHYKHGLSFIHINLFSDGKKDCSRWKPASWWRLFLLFLFFFRLSTFSYFLFEFLTCFLIAL